MEWFAQDAVTRARSKIGEGPAINEHLDTFWCRFRQGVTDDLEGIRRMELGLTGELSPVGAYGTARPTRGKLMDRRQSDVRRLLSPCKLT